MKKTKKKCPRCRSTRLRQRLSGQNWCEKCGQRWEMHGLLIPSFDRRKLTGEEKPDENASQLFLTLD